MKLPSSITKAKSRGFELDEKQGKFEMDKAFLKISSADILVRL